jgi:hypothetical protein
MDRTNRTLVKARFLHQPKGLHTSWEIRKFSTATVGSVAVSCLLQCTALFLQWVDGRNSRDLVEQQILIALLTNFPNGRETFQTAR